MTHDIHIPPPVVHHTLQKVMDHLALVRPAHWSKTLIAVPIGPVLLLRDASVTGALAVLGTITMFIVASAAVYIINDLSDVERDRLHPTKRNRPLASGAVTQTAAFIMLACLAAAMVALYLAVPPLVTAVVVVYLACNLAYSMWLKHVPIIEMLIVAAGFSLRTSAGYIAFGVVPDPWVITTVLTGSLLLTVGKRRDELRRVSASSKHRPVLAHYTDALLDAYLIVAAIACVGLGIAALFTNFDAVSFYVSLPFVTYLFKRYLLLAFAGHGTSNPTRLLLGDRTTHYVLLAWLLSIGLFAAVGDISFASYVAAAL